MASSPKRPHAAKARTSVKSVLNIAGQYQEHADLISKRAFEAERRLSTLKTAASPNSPFVDVDAIASLIKEKYARLERLEVIVKRTADTIGVSESQTDSLDLHVGKAVREEREKREALERHLVSITKELGASNDNLLNMTSEELVAESLRIMRELKTTADGKDETIKERDTDLRRIKALLDSIITWSGEDKEIVGRVQAMQIIFDTAISDKARLENIVSDWNQYAVERNKRMTELQASETDITLTKQSLDSTIARANESLDMLSTDDRDSPLQTRVRRVVDLAMEREKETTRLQTEETRLQAREQELEAKIASLEKDIQHQRAVLDLISGGGTEERLRKAQALVASDTILQKKGGAKEVLKSLASFEQQVGEFEAASAKDKAALADSRTRENELEKNVKTLQKKIRELQTSYEDSSREVAQLTASNKTLRDRTDALASEKSKLSQENQDTRSSLESITKEGEGTPIEKVMAYVSDLRVKSGNIGGKEGVDEKRVGALLRLEANFKVALGKDADSVKDLAAEFIQWQTRGNLQISRLDTDLAAERRRVEEYSTQHKKVLQKIPSLYTAGGNDIYSATEAMTKALEVKEAENVKLRNDNDKRKDEVSSLKTEAKQSSKEVASLTEKNRTLVQENGGLGRYLADIKCACRSQSAEDSAIAAIVKTLRDNATEGDVPHAIIIALHDKVGASPPNVDEVVSTIRGLRRLSERVADAESNLDKARAETLARSLELDTARNKINELKSKTADCDSGRLILQSILPGGGDARPVGKLASDVKAKVEKQDTETNQKNQEILDLKEEVKKKIKLLDEQQKLTEAAEARVEKEHKERRNVESDRRKLNGSMQYIAHGKSPAVPVPEITDLIRLAENAAAERIRKISGFEGDIAEIQRILAAKGGEKTADAASRVIRTLNAKDSEMRQFSNRVAIEAQSGTTPSREETLDEAKTRAVDAVIAQRRKLSDLEAQEATSKSRVKRFSDKMSAAKRFNEGTSNESKLTQILAELEFLRKTKTELEANVAGLKVEVASCRDTLRSTAGEKSKAENDLTLATNTLAGIRKSLQIGPQANGAQIERAVEKAVVGLSTAEETVKQKTQSLQALQQKNASAEEAKVRLETDLAAKDRMIKALSKSGLVKTETGGGSKLDPGEVQALGDLKANYGSIHEIAIAMGDLDAKKRELARLEKKLQRLEEEADTYSSQKSDVESKLRREETENKSTKARLEEAEKKNLDLTVSTAQLNAELERMKSEKDEMEQMLQRSLGISALEQGESLLQRVSRELESRQESVHVPDPTAPVDSDGLVKLQVAVNRLLGTKEIDSRTLADKVDAWNTETKKKTSSLQKELEKAKKRVGVLEKARDEVAGELGIASTDNNTIKKAVTNIVQARDTQEKVLNKAIQDNDSLRTESDTQKRSIETLRKVDKKSKELIDEFKALAGRVRTAVGTDARASFESAVTQVEQLANSMDTSRKSDPGQEIPAEISRALSQAPKTVKGALKQIAALQELSNANEAMIRSYKETASALEETTRKLHAATETATSSRAAVGELATVGDVLRNAIASSQPKPASANEDTPLGLANTIASVISNAGSRTRKLEADVQNLDRTIASQQTTLKTQEANLATVRKRLQEISEELDQSNLKLGSLTSAVTHITGASRDATDLPKLVSEKFTKLDAEIQTLKASENHLKHESKQSELDRTRHLGSLGDILNPDRGNGTAQMATELTSFEEAEDRTHSTVRTLLKSEDENKKLKVDVSSAWNEVDALLAVIGKSRQGTDMQRAIRDVKLQVETWKAAATDAEVQERTVKNLQKDMEKILAESLKTSDELALLKKSDRIVKILLEIKDGQKVEDVLQEKIAELQNSKLETRLTQGKLDSLEEKHAELETETARLKASMASAPSGVVRVEAGSSVDDTRNLDQMRVLLASTNRNWDTLSKKFDKAQKTIASHEAAVEVLAGVKTTLRDSVGADTSQPDNVTALASRAALTIIQLREDMVSLKETIATQADQIISGNAELEQQTTENQALIKANETAVADRDIHANRNESVTAILKEAFSLTGTVPALAQTAGDAFKTLKAKSKDLEASVATLEASLNAARLAATNTEDQRRQCKEKLDDIETNTEYIVRKLELSGDKDTNYQYFKDVLLKKFHEVSESLSAEKARNKNEKDRYKIDIANKDAQIKDLTTTSAQLQQDLKAYETKISANVVTIETLTSQTNAARLYFTTRLGPDQSSALPSFDDLIEKTRNKHFELKGELAGKDVEIESLEKKVKGLEGEIETKREESVRKSTRRDSELAAVTQILDQIKAHTAENYSLEKHAADIVGLYRAQNMRVTGLESDIASLKGEVKNKEKTAVSSADSLQKEIDRRDERITHLEDDNRSLERSWMTKVAEFRANHTKETADLKKGFEADKDALNKRIADFQKKARERVPQRSQETTVQGTAQGFAAVQEAQRKQLQEERDKSDALRDELATLKAQLGATSQRATRVQPRTQATGQDDGGFNVAVTLDREPGVDLMQWISSFKYKSDKDRKKAEDKLKSFEQGDEYKYLLDWVLTLDASRDLDTRRIKQIIRDLARKTNTIPALDTTNQIKTLESIATLTGFLAGTDDFNHIITMISNIKGFVEASAKLGDQSTGPIRGDDVVYLQSIFMAAEGISNVPQNTHRLSDVVSKLTWESLAAVKEYRKANAILSRVYHTVGRSKQDTGARFLGGNVYVDLDALDDDFKAWTEKLITLVGDMGKSTATLEKRADIALDISKHVRPDGALNLQVFNDWKSVGRLADNAFSATDVWRTKPAVWRLTRAVDYANMMKESFVDPIKALPNTVERTVFLPIRAGLSLYRRLANASDDIAKDIAQPVNFNGTLDAYVAAGRDLNKDPRETLEPILWSHDGQYDIDQVKTAITLVKALSRQNANYTYFTTPVQEPAGLKYMISTFNAAIAMRDTFDEMTKLATYSQTHRRQQSTNLSNAVAAWLDLVGEKVDGNGGLLVAYLKTSISAVVDGLSLRWAEDGASNLRDMLLGTGVALKMYNIKSLITFAHDLKEIARQAHSDENKVREALALHISPEETVLQRIKAGAITDGNRTIQKAFESSRVFAVHVDSLAYLEIIKSNIDRAAIPSIIKERFGKAVEDGARWKEIADVCAKAAVAEHVTATEDVHPRVLDYMKRVGELSTALRASSPDSSEYVAFKFQRVFCTWIKEKALDDATPYAGQYTEEANVLLELFDSLGSGDVIPSEYLRVMARKDVPVAVISLMREIDVLGESITVQRSPVRKVVVDLLGALHPYHYRQDIWRGRIDDVIGAAVSVSLLTEVDTVKAMSDTLKEGAGKRRVFQLLAKAHDTVFGLNDAVADASIYDYHRVYLEPPKVLEKLKQADEIRKHVEAAFRETDGVPFGDMPASLGRALEHLGKAQKVVEPDRTVKGLEDRLKVPLAYYGKTLDALKNSPVRNILDLETGAMFSWSTGQNGSATDSYHGFLVAAFEMAQATRTLDLYLQATHDSNKTGVQRVASDQVKNLYKTLGNVAEKLYNRKQDADVMARFYNDLDTGRNILEEMVSMTGNSQDPIGAWIDSTERIAMVLSSNGVLSAQDKEWVDVARDMKSVREHLIGSLGRKDVRESPIQEGIQELAVGLRSMLDSQSTEQFLTAARDTWQSLLGITTYTRTEPHLNPDNVDDHIQLASVLRRDGMPTTKQSANLLQGVFTYEDEYTNIDSALKSVQALSSDLAQRGVGGMIGRMFRYLHNNLRWFSSSEEAFDAITPTQLKGRVNPKFFSAAVVELMRVFPPPFNASGQTLYSQGEVDTYMEEVRRKVGSDFNQDKILGQAEIDVASEFLQQLGIDATGIVEELSIMTASIPSLLKSSLRIASQLIYNFPLDSEGVPHALLVDGDDSDATAEALQTLGNVLEQQGGVYLASRANAIAQARFGLFRSEYKEVHGAVEPFLDYIRETSQEVLNKLTGTVTQLFNRDRSDRQTTIWTEVDHLLGGKVDTRMYSTRPAPPSAWGVSQGVMLNLDAAATLLMRMLVVLAAQTDPVLAMQVDLKWHVDNVRVEEFSWYGWDYAAALLGLTHRTAFLPGELASQMHSFRSNWYVVDPLTPDQVLSLTIRRQPPQSKWKAVEEYIHQRPEGNIISADRAWASCMLTYAHRQSKMGGWRSFERTLTHHELALIDFLNTSAATNEYRKLDRKSVLMPRDRLTQEDVARYRMVAADLALHVIDFRYLARNRYAMLVDGLYLVHPDESPLEQGSLRLGQVLSATMKLLLSLDTETDRKDYYISPEPWQRWRRNDAVWDKVEEVLEYAIRFHQRVHSDSPLERDPQHRNYVSTRDIEGPPSNATHVLAIGQWRASLSTYQYSVIQRCYRAGILKPATISEMPSSMLTDFEAALYAIILFEGQVDLVAKAITVTDNTRQVERDTRAMELEMVSRLRDRNLIHYRSSAFDRMNHRYLARVLASNVQPADIPLPWVLLDSRNNTISIGSQDFSVPGGKLTADQIRYIAVAMVYANSSHNSYFSLNEIPSLSEKGLDWLRIQPVSATALNLAAEATYSAAGESRGAMRNVGAPPERTTVSSNALMIRYDSLFDMLQLEKDVFESEGAMVGAILALSQAWSHDRNSASPMLWQKMHLDIRRFWLLVELSDVYHIELSLEELKKMLGIASVPGTAPGTIQDRDMVLLAMWRQRRDSTDASALKGAWAAWLDSHRTGSHPISAIDSNIGRKMHDWNSRYFSDVRCPYINLLADSHRVAYTNFAY